MLGQYARPRLVAMTSWADVWAKTTEQLGDSEAARHIVEQASGRMGASWLVIMDTQAPEGAFDRVQQMVKRRLAGEPLQYVLGHWGFRSLSLAVDSRVLIPRPETEQVVEAALPLIKRKATATVVDLRHRFGCDRTFNRQRSSVSQRSCNGRFTGRVGSCPEERRVAWAQGASFTTGPGLRRCPKSERRS